MILFCAGTLVLGYLLGIGTAVMIQGTPPAPPPTTTTAEPAPAIAPPSNALGNLSAEIRELENILATDPGNYPVLVRLGNLYFDTDQYTNAIDAYSKALAIQGGDPNVLTDRGIMYRRIGDFQAALADFRAGAAADPSHLNSQINMGIVYRYDLNDVANAIQAWEGYLLRNPPPEMAEKIRREIDTLKAQLPQ
jgi:tetratricopeptide (TPR) repeat protein